jgi:hypothetical protein
LAANPLKFAGRKNNQNEDMEKIRVEEAGTDMDGLKIDFGFWIADFGFDNQSEIRNPKSAIRNTNLPFIKNSC